MSDRLNIASATRGNASLVPFLFGAAALEAFPGTALSRLLTDLGLTEAAARTIVARLRRRGLLVSDRVGRRTTYRLNGAMREGFERVRVGAPRRKWEGHFYSVVYLVPEAHREYRDRLRNELLHAGYQMLRPGLLISAEEQAGMVERLASRAPRGARVIGSRLSMSVDDARFAAEETWGLAARSRVYRREAAKLLRMSRRPSRILPSPDTLREFYAIQQVVIQLALTDPGLPPELLPDDWPVMSTMEAPREFYTRWVPPVLEYTNSVLRDTGTEDIALQAEFAQTSGFHRPFLPHPGDED